MFLPRDAAFPGVVMLRRRRAEYSGADEGSGKGEQSCYLEILKRQACGTYFARVVATNHFPLFPSVIFDNAFHPHTFPTFLLQPISATTSTRRASRNGCRGSRLRCSARSPEWTPCQRRPRKCSGSTSRRNLSTSQLSSPRSPSRVPLPTRRESLYVRTCILGTSRAFPNTGGGGPCGASTLRISTIDHDPTHFHAQHRQFSFSRRLRRWVSSDSSQVQCSPLSRSRCCSPDGG